MCVFFIQFNDTAVNFTGKRHFYNLNQFNGPSQISYLPEYDFDIQLCRGISHHR